MSELKVKPLKPREQSSDPATAPGVAAAEQTGTDNPDELRQEHEQRQQQADQNGRPLQQAQRQPPAQADQKPDGEPEHASVALFRLR